MAKKPKKDSLTHINPLTGFRCYYDPECPICEEKGGDWHWNRLLEKESKADDK